MSRRSVRSAVALAAIASLVLSGAASAKSPSATLLWTGNHGDVVAELNPGSDPAWDQGDGITDGTFGVTVFWPGEHIRSAVLHRIDSGDWASYSGNTVAWGIGVSLTPNGALINAPDSTFDVATNAKGWAAFTIHVDNVAEGNYFSGKSQYQLYLCNDTTASNCIEAPTITIR